MADKNAEVPDLESLRTVTDDEIVTERKLPRRSFLSRTGAVLAGAAGIVSGVRAAAPHSPQQDDPDKKPADPDKKPADPNKRTDDPHKRADDTHKREDDTHKREDDTRKKADDPDKKPADPDKRPPDDPHR
jgi:hypothetical protein